DAELVLDALPGDAGVVGAAALRRHPQLLEYLLGVRVREVLAPVEAAGEIDQDLPVQTGLAGRLLGGVELDDAPLDVGGGALVLLMQRAGHDDVGVERGLGYEEVDDGVVLELVERLSGEGSVGQRDGRVEAD